MKTDHLSAWEQEEYILNQGAEQQNPQVIRHLAECVACRSEVARLEHGVSIFRTAAVEWSSQCLATHSQQLQSVPLRRLPIVAMRWALAAAVPLALLLLALLPLHLFRLSGPQITHPPVQISAAQISDDALLEQVDEQVSVAVPSSMESLTHLVSADTTSGTATKGSKRIVQTN
jgi:predicted anti-sigma-YlaC factor YlaD